MVRFIADDKLPDEANELLVKYTGSKGTFSGLTGFATTKASQSIVVEVDASDEYYDFYMIPRDERENRLGREERLPVCSSVSRGKSDRAVRKWVHPTACGKSVSVECQQCGSCGS